MQPEQKTFRQLIRKIGSTSFNSYLTPSKTRQQLGYIQSCLYKVENADQYHELVSIDCEMVETTTGFQICRVMVISESHDILMSKNYTVCEGSEVTNYLTHITGFTEKDLKEIPKNQVYGKEEQLKIQQLIQNKIVCGHDLSNDLKLLQITHSAFIDTVALFPHPFGLPFKIKLRDLASNELHRHIQWSAHDPLQDTEAVLDLIVEHCGNGRGIIEVQEFPVKQYKNIEEILQDAELDINKMRLFVLRGSRALGLTIQMEGYKSDWDYVAVYKTEAKIDGKLIKLPEIDISIFDEKSFLNHIQNNNDISYLQIFFLPKEYIYINKIEVPQLSIRRMRQSLGFHLNKAKMKVNRLMKEVDKNPSMELKILKCLHMKLRFMDNFIQLKEQVDLSQKEMKIDVTRLKNLWEEIKVKYYQTNFKATFLWLQKLQKQKKDQVNSVYDFGKRLRNVGYDRSFKNKKIHTFSEKQKKKMQLNERRGANNLRGGRGRGRGNYRQKNEFIEYSSQNIKMSKISEKLETVKFLRRNYLEEIEEYRVTYKRHRKYTNLIQFHYLNSASFNNEIEKECRGLILDESRNYEVVAFPYCKFFDYNDPKHTQINEIDMESLKIYEKKDGSISFLYYYNGEWNVASSSIPDGLNSYCFGKKETTTQFKKQFWKIFYGLKYELPSVEDKNKTFIFELMSKNHIIVVEREKSDLCLHGVRNIETLQEQDHMLYGKKYKWNVCEPLDIEFKKIEDIVKVAEKINPLKSEGFVVCDKNWRRMKIKNSEYVRINWLGELNMHHNKDPKKFILVEIILSGEGQIFSKYCPEWQKLIKEYTNKIRCLNKEVEGIYEERKHLEKKKFAQQVNRFEKDIQSFVYGLRGNYQKYHGRVEYILNPKKLYKFLQNYKP